MKKIAIIAVVALGLAACQDNAPDNATSTLNTIETEAASDTNSSMNSMDNGAMATDNALDAAGNATANAASATGNAMSNTANAVDNTHVTVTTKK